MKIGHIHPCQSWPITNGSDGRHLQIDNLLKKLGHEVINLSTYNNKRKWDQKSLDHFRLEMGEISIFNTRIELANIVKNRGIDLLLVDYMDTGIEFDIPGLDVPCILDVTDIGIFNFEYEERLLERLKKEEYNNLNPIPVKDEWVNITEFKKYDKILTIAKHESLKLSELGIENTYIPYSPTIRLIKNKYETFPLVVGGQSTVNMHGLYWLDRVMGETLFSRIPDMRIDVAGVIDQWVNLSDRFIMHGFIENLDSIFKYSRFGVCPSIYGTGQKIKILEMMGASLPVVAYRTASAESPLDNESGLISDDPQEWMEVCTELWLNRTKCRQMGEIARQQVESWFPLEKQLERLSSLL